MMDRQVKERALHIYYAGEGSVKNEIVEDVLEELNERLGGYWGTGASNDEITWIEKINWVRLVGLKWRSTEMKSMNILVKCQEKS